MNLHQYEHQIVQIHDRSGRIFTGIPDSFPPEYGLHEFGRDEESLRLGINQIFESDIAGIGVLPDMKILRAVELWQQAGAYYVRIQAMAKSIISHSGRNSTCMTPRKQSTS